MNHRVPADPQAVTLDKAYQPAGIERHWYAVWEEAGYFRPGGAGPGYCIMLPPPNVTGSLHMGHAFQQTLMDILIRYHRMQGDNTLWQGGTDHAGIATQLVVERQLEQQGRTRHDLGRERFLEAVWKWRETSGNTITRQSRRLGTSMDWSRERFTMDEELSTAVQEVFVRLHEDGLIYRGKRLVNWDPVLHTAISDLEVVSSEEHGSLWHIRYPLDDGSGQLVVATTRPETMLGDAAVAVHPGDERYRSFIGKWIRLPITNRRIPVIQDEHVDPAFGTGCVKITPGHDFNDYEMRQRHLSDGLGLFNIFTRDAAIVGDTSPSTSRSGDPEAGQQGGEVVDLASDIGIPGKYWGLDRFKARELILEDLKALGALEKEQPHKLMIPRGDRSGVIIEPLLTDQWYVKIAPLAAPAIEAVESGRVKFVPENWAKTYFEWMRNIQDWCISRQLWWGHRIPAWYDKADGSRVFVGRSEAEIRARHQLGDEVQLVQDEDVLDTWFSSALWPFSTLGWPTSTPQLETFYPTSVLVTGFDIIFFWVARMIMMGLRFMGDVPFREVYIHGLVRDADGQKMSKSKGNILDPLDLIDGIELEALVTKRTAGLLRPKDAPRIEKSTRKEFPDGIAAYGTDALRFTFAALASPGRNVNFDVGRIAGYRNFCNKLWNAARYVLMSCAEEDLPADASGLRPGLPERWIRSRLAYTIAATREAIGNYRFDLAAQSIHEFTWSEYCDWYLELSKPVLTDPQAPAAVQRGTRHTLLHVLETLLRLAHPVMPFITEEIWQRVAPRCGRTGATISLQPYPGAADAAMDPEAERCVAWLQSFVLGVRRIRAEMNIAPARPLKVLVAGGNKEENAWLADNRAFLGALARLESIQETAAPVSDAATALAGEMSLFIPLADLIDPRAEIDRLGKELNGRRQEFSRARGKLENSQFLERAPRDIVEMERKRHDELLDVIRKLEQQIGTLTDIARQRGGQVPD